MGELCSRPPLIYDHQTACRALPLLPMQRPSSTAVEQDAAAVSWPVCVSAASRDFRPPCDRILIRLSTTMPVGARRDEEERCFFPCVSCSVCVEVGSVLFVPACDLHEQKVIFSIPCEISHLTALSPFHLTICFSSQCFIIQKISPSLEYGGRGWGLLMLHPSVCPVFNYGMFRLNGCTSTPLYLCRQLDSSQFLGTSSAPPH